ncbi:YbhB/YbcL family Raf kinase inhibitor-like protein [Candidatus Kaiserbacteria bacterium CG10_big_fil_rev_8_21_14_0_10_56_12]|uniref:YbhB/YbcL family Raf kinase inhibitor-like protein n=1 Tax=Candidatus Kaiserbacteria bacterium CG10_big_fil_rev_8_21_14_0_10_56_12 TaxID=1974611 RepID=A0A2H0U9T0_9BACT|nr:MAG: YbhB/YbcL family Raf kinase inhibitor-like protein [Candidatus Kaiserbacteria bacterium CG10_big_fil_rev_8_21_14_0_10_56_12]
MALSLVTSAFENGGRISAKYTCDGDKRLSPPLSIRGVPEGAKSFVLIMDDPDIPEVKKKEYGIDSFDHWTLFNIPPETREIPEGGLHGCVTGVNTLGESHYTGPCPPPEYEPKEHRYFFKLYALRDTLSLSEGATKRQVLDALDPLVIEQAEYMGRYSRT